MAPKKCQTKHNCQACRVNSNRAYRSSHTQKAQRSQGNFKVLEKPCLEGIKIAPISPFQESLREKRADW